MAQDVEIYPGGLYLVGIPCWGPTMEFEHKDFSLSVKAVDLGESTFEGHSAGIGNEDDGRDVIMPGAFRKTMRERLRGGHVKLINGHDTRDTRNLWGQAIEAEERPYEGKRVRGQEPPTHVLWSRSYVTREAADAQEALRKVEEGTLNGLSIGYRPIKVEYQPYEGDDFSEEADPVWEWLMGRARRLIKELAWWEHSLVTFGMNPYALALPGTVKALLVQVEAARERHEQVPEEDVKRTIRALSEMLRQPDRLELFRRLAGHRQLGEQLDVVTESLAVPERDREAVWAMFQGFQARVKDAAPASSFVSYLDRLGTLALEGELEDKVVPGDVSRTKAPESTPWAKPTLSDFTDESWEDLSSGEKRRIARHFAWAAAMPPDTFGDLKLPHHRAQDGAVVWRGVSAAMNALLGGRGGVDIPAGDRRAVYDHLASHYKQFDREPPEFKALEDLPPDADPEAADAQPTAGQEQGHSTEPGQHFPSTEELEAEMALLELVRTEHEHP